jgi:hypothetical protein
MHKARVDIKMDKNLKLGVGEEGMKENYRGDEPN